MSSPTNGNGVIGDPWSMNDADPSTNPAYSKDLQPNDIELAEMQKNAAKDAGQQPDDAPAGDDKASSTHLKFGSRDKGDDNRVATVQEFLNKTFLTDGKDELSVSGYFGHDTKRIVEEWQKKYNEDHKGQDGFAPLKTDGAIGDKTLAAMQESPDFAACAESAKQTQESYKFAQYNDGHDIIHLGDKSDTVAAIQRRMNEKLGPDHQIEVDGTWGAKSAAAYKIYQKEVLGFEHADGIPGPASYARDEDFLNPGGAPNKDIAKGQNADKTPTKDADKPTPAGGMIAPMGTDMALTQQFLNDHFKDAPGYTPLTVDGLGGNKTKAAIKEYQEEYNKTHADSPLATDGTPAPKTRAAMEADGLSLSAEAKAALPAELQPKLEQLDKIAGATKMAPSVTLTKAGTTEGHGINQSQGQDIGASKGKN